MQGLPFWWSIVREKGSFCIPSFTSIIMHVPGVMLCLLGMQELPFWFLKKRQLLHPPLHRHHPAGARGDALHAGDAGAAFLVVECREKRQL